MNGSQQSAKTTICLTYTVNVTKLWHLADASGEHYPFSWQKILHEGLKFFCSEVYSFFTYFAR